MVEPPDVKVGGYDEDCVKKNIEKILQWVHEVARKIEEAVERVVKEEGRQYEEYEDFWFVTYV